MFILIDKILTFIFIFILYIIPGLYFIYLLYFSIKNKRYLSKLFAKTNVNLTKLLLYLIFPPISWFLVSKTILLKYKIFVKKRNSIPVWISGYLFFWAIAIFDYLFFLNYYMLELVNSSFYFMLLTFLIYWSLPLSLIYLYSSVKLTNKTKKNFANSEY